MKKTLITNNIKKKEFSRYILDKVKDFDFTHADKFSINIEEFANKEAQHARDIEICMSLLAYVKMSKLVATCDKEIAWHGYVTKDGDCYTIEDIFMYPQKATATTVNADEEAYGPWMIKNIKEKLNTVRMQGHSHVNMGVSPSHTDLDYYKDLLGHVTDFYIFLVINKRGEVHTRLYDKTQNVLYTEIPLKIVHEGNILDLNDWVKSNMNLMDDKSKNIPYTAKVDYFSPPSDKEQNEWDKYAHWERYGTTYR